MLCARLRRHQWQMRRVAALMPVMSTQIRKGQVGQPGNKGQYARHIRDASGIELGGGFTSDPNHMPWDNAATPYASTEDRAAWRIDNAEVLDSQLTGRDKITLIQTLRLPEAGPGTERATIRSTVVTDQQWQSVGVESWDGKQWQELHRLTENGWITPDTGVDTQNYWLKGQRETTVQQMHDLINAETRTAVKFIS